MKIICPTCGNEKPIDYFTYINKLKEKYELKTGLEPTHLIVDINNYYKMENSEDLLKRLIYVKDTTQGVLGNYIAGLKIIKTQNIEGIKVGYLMENET